MKVISVVFATVVVLSTAVFHKKSIESQEEFEREVRHSNTPTLVEFYADHCGQCNTFEEVWYHIAYELSDDVKVTRVRVESDDSIRLVNKLGVEFVPVSLS